MLVEAFVKIRQSFVYRGSARVKEVTITKQDAMQILIFALEERFGEEWMVVMLN